MTDPFDALSAPIERRQPRSSFARDLRSRLVDALDLDSLAVIRTVDHPGRTPMSPERITTEPPVATRRSATPYLCVDDGAAAIDWYAEAFGAVETMRVVGDDGRLGHAEITIGGAGIMLSSEYPEVGVVSPHTLGGTTVTIHLEVEDVDSIYGRAVRAGASGRTEPADQPHGARHGSLVDPFGHRWMLSQPIEDVDLATYAARSRGSGFEVRRGPRAGGRYVDGIWGVVAYRDVDAGIRFATDVLGFEELVLVRDDQGGVVHSEYRWPEGGIVQIASVQPGNPFVPEPGSSGGVYVVTQDPHAVWERCRRAGVEVIRSPEEPHYDPGGMGFSVRDAEGNAWSFGSYAGGAAE